MTETAVPDRLRAALAGRYDLHHELGRGGMATVYLAADRRHHRDVAVKVLRPDLAATLGAERFLKEIEIAARLNHPLVLPLHDSGESDGFLWYVMPYVDGGSLRSRLLERRRLDLAGAIGIAERVADALTYAHRMGVMHRDIKPENILFSQGHPLVADFGIARAVSTAGAANITRTGFPLGTPGYMSPEQAAGLAEVDERSDVYALAVVTYEMLVGEIPGRWPTEDNVRAGRFADVALAHRAVLDGLPRQVESALVHAMAVRLDQRTASPSGFIGELTRAEEPRRYSEAEVQAIVRRASEAEAGLRTVDGAMTLGGIEKLGAEVGIAPDQIRSAAGSVHTDSPLLQAPPAGKFAGSPMRVIVDRLVDGVVADVDLPVLIDEVRRSIGSAGSVDTMYRSVSWSIRRTSQGGRDMSVTISTRGGRTRITAHESFDMDVAGIGVMFFMGGGLAGGGIVAGILGGALHLPVLIPILAPFWLGANYVAFRRTVRGTYNTKLTELDNLVNRLSDLARGLAVPERAIAEAPRPRLGPAQERNATTPT